MQVWRVFRGVEGGFGSELLAADRKGQSEFCNQLASNLEVWVSCSVCVVARTGLLDSNRKFELSLESGLGRVCCRLRLQILRSPHFRKEILLRLVVELLNCHLPHCTLLPRCSPILFIPEFTSYD